MDSQHLHNVVTVYSCILSSYVTNADEYSSQVRNSPFHSMYASPLSVRDFVERIYRYFNCSAECYLLSLIYIDRIIHLNSFIINAYSVHRVILTSLMLAAKYFDDVYFTNTFYAEVGGITVNEINYLEVEFLCRIHFNLYVSSQDYLRYYNDISEHITYCQNCCSIRVPSLVNITPYDEMPLLRYREHRSAMDTMSNNSYFSMSMGPYSGYGYTSSGGFASGYSLNSNQGYYSSLNYASVANYASELGSLTPTTRMY